jgi:hypothetical protein
MNLKHLNSTLNSDALRRLYAIGLAMSAPYNMAFACLRCCKSFKRHCELSAGIPEELPCPECGGLAHNFGRHFKAPKKTDVRQWEKVRFLFGHGFRFQKIRTGPGHHDTVAYPETLEEAKEFVVKYKQYSVSSSNRSENAYNSSLNTDAAAQSRLA